MLQNFTENLFKDSSFTGHLFHGIPPGDFFFLSFILSMRGYELFEELPEVSDSRYQIISNVSI